MDTQLLYAQKLEKENFHDWFIDDFYGFNFETIELRIEQYTFVFEDGKTNKAISPTVRITGTFNGTLFFNRAGYFRVNFIDFTKKHMNGSIYRESFESVFKQEFHDQLNLNQYESR
jgi:hypothetical protein